MSRNSTVAPAWLLSAGSLIVLGALLSAALIVALRPVLTQYALARPSARGLHTVPTPQGGGIAVLLSCATVAALGSLMVDLDAEGLRRLSILFAATAGLGVVGLVDDIRPLPALPRLALHLVFMGIGVAALPEGTRVLPFLPLAAERVLLVLGGTWFVNLTNFMDGMDGITVADLCPPACLLVVAAAAGLLPVEAGLVATGLLAGLIGFAPFNRPVARLFLGDVGSLPLGLLLAYGLFSLAGQANGSVPGALAAAILLPLYPIADSGITLGRRLARRERIWEPHRTHFYQQAVSQGRRVTAVLVRILLTNAGLGILAWASLGRGGSTSAAALVLGAATVAVLLRWLSRAPEGVA